jgi:integrase/recombinase XerD
MPRKGWRKPVVGDVDDPEGLVAWSRRYLEDRRVHGYAERTLVMMRGYLAMFIEWAFHRGITAPTQVTKVLIDQYRKALHHLRRPDGRPLTLSSQRARLQRVRSFCKWLAKKDALPFNPADELELPRLPRQLPRAVLGEKEVERVLAMPSTKTATGLRDRAMMEVLYSTGIRRAELAALYLSDIDEERGTVMVRMGKGKKDRVVPIGERALMWVGRYVEEARPSLLGSRDRDVLFLSRRGEPMELSRVTRIMGSYVEAAGVDKKGACHIFRHSMATLMLEHGADVRLIQEILGHAELSTTEIYTRVSIQHLKRVHERTHPGAKLGRRKSRE